MKQTAHLRHQLHRASNLARWSSYEHLCLDEMADAACLSKYHFVRAFKELYRETPIEHFTRIRLEQAAARLTYAPDQSLIDIGFGAGFASAQSFSNAFRKRYGLPPGGFRRLNTGLVKDFPENQYLKSEVLSGLPCQPACYETDQQAEFAFQNTMRIAYIRSHGAYYLQSKSRTHYRLKLLDWAKRKGLWHQSLKLIGVCPDHSSITPPPFCQYDIGIEVDASIREDDVVSIQTLPAVQVAKTYVTGTAEVARNAWSWLARTWIPQNKCRVRPGNYYEVLTFDFTKDAGTFLGAELRIPIRPMGATDCSTQPFDHALDKGGKLGSRVSV